MKHIFTSLLVLFLSTTVFGQLIINEVLYDPSNNALDGDANGDGAYDQEEDSFIEFVNNSTSPLDVSGYQIWDDTTAGALMYTIAPSTVIPAMGALVVFGGGTPTGTFGGALVQTADTSAVGLNLNNSGEVIVIKDASGTTILTFDSDALSNNPNESYTRFPDITGDFLQHGDTTAVLFSPGTRTNGAPFGITIVMVDSIYVEGTGGVDFISMEAGTLQMVANVFPTNADDQSITWSITAGEELAEISSSGMLSALDNGTVTVTATANDGSGVTGSADILISNQPNAVAEIGNKLNVSVFPNPTNGLVKISANEVISSIEVYDIIGRKQLSKTTLQSNMLDLSGLAEGQYILKITSGEATQTAIIVKQ